MATAKKVVSAKTFTDAAGNVRAVGTGALIKAAPKPAPKNPNAQTFTDGKGTVRPIAAAAPKPATPKNPNAQTFTDGNGKVRPIVKPTGKKPKPGATAPVAGSTTPTEDGSLTAHLTDPIYQQEHAGLDLELANAKNTYDQAMGSGGAKGQIWQDYDYAVNALTRDTRKNTSQTNAGLSGSNLAGSGIAKKQLSDVAAGFFSDKGKLDTDRTRAEAGATQSWSDAQNYYKAGDAAGVRGAANRWSLTNEAPDPAPAVKKTVGKAPKGMAYTKNKTTGLFSLKPTKPAAKKTVGKAPPGMKYVKNPLTSKYTLKKV